MQNGPTMIKVSFIWFNLIKITFSLEGWPGSCQTGNAQSPVAIYDEESINLRRVPDLQFSNAYFYEYSANITNDGHSGLLYFY